MAVATRVRVTLDQTTPGSHRIKLLDLTALTEDELRTLGALLSKSLLRGTDLGDLFETSFFVQAAISPTQEPDGELLSRVAKETGLTFHSHYPSLKTISVGVSSGFEDRKFLEELPETVKKIREAFDRFV